MVLFHKEFHSEEEMEQQFQLFLTEYSDIQSNEFNNLKDKDKEFIHDRVFSVIPLIPKIDAAIDAVAEGWKTNRMGRVDLTILRLAYYEMKNDEDVPDAVAINEAVELAKKYGTDDSPAFVNGILAKLV